MDYQKFTSQNKLKKKAVETQKSEYIAILNFSGLKFTPIS